MNTCHDKIIKNLIKIEIRKHNFIFLLYVITFKYDCFKIACVPVPSVVFDKVPLVVLTAWSINIFEIQKKRVGMLKCKTFQNITWNGNRLGITPVGPVELTLCKSWPVQSKNEKIKCVLVPRNKPPAPFSPYTTSTAVANCKKNTNWNRSLKQS